MNKILITGGSGFIGRAVLDACRNSGTEINATYNTRVCPEHNEVVWHQIDLLDTSSITELFKKIRPKYLIQLAWCTGQGTYWKDEANLDWISANLSIARNFVINGGVRCLFAGTSAEYDWTSNQPLDEVATKLEPLLLYGGSKLALYWGLKKYFEQHNTSFVWARFFNPFGQGEDPKRLIPKTCLRLLNGEKLEFDKAASLRDFLHVKDVGEAIYHLLYSNITGPVNVASGQPLAVREVITSIAQVYDRLHQVNFETVESANAIADAVVANTTRLNSEAGWQSRKTFKERIIETCEWWKDEYKNLQKK
jgi:nucleoside-diphosphate-sugar epimerase